MQAHYYAEKSGAFPRRFELIGSTLTIVPKHGSPVVVDLADVQAEPRRCIGTNVGILLRSLGLVVVIIGTACICVFRFSLPLLIVAPVALFFVFPPLRIFVMSVPPIRADRFYSRNGQLAFDVVLDQDPDSEREVFLEVLRSRMNGHKSA